MLKNYLTIALRNLLRKKGYSLLNVAGLALGMACCLLILQFVVHEYSYDRFNTNAANLYRLVGHSTQNGRDEGTSSFTSYLAGPTFAAETPEIVRYARVHPNYGDAVISYERPGGNQTFKETRVYYADSTFLRMFTYPLVAGDVQTALTEPQTLLVSASTAKKYFGDADPVGQTLRVTGWVNGPYTVAGVFEDVPATSHLRFDFLLPIADLLRSDQYQQEGSGWGWHNFNTYVELSPQADTGHVAEKLSAVFYSHRKEQFDASKREVDVLLQPITDIHLNADISGPMVVMGDYKTVYFFGVVALLTLVVALVNYVNLATARAMDRAREVGVRKVVGAGRRQLVTQFLFESALTNLSALVLAVGLTLALTPVVGRLADVELAGALWLDVRFWAAFLVLFGLGALLAGLYPAFVLSSFRPVVVLKGKAGAHTSRFALRKVLVVLQFAVSIALVAGTVIVYAQLDHMRRMDLGLDLERIVVVEGPRVRPEGVDRVQTMNTFKDELRKLPAVQDLALSATVPGRGFNWYTSAWKATADPSTSQDVRASGIDEHFAGLYGLELTAGQPFREGAVAFRDSVDTVLLVNQTFARKMGFETDADALDQRISLGGGDRFVIQGVYADFNWSSAHQETEAVAFFYNPAGGNISLRVSSDDLPATIASIRDLFESLFPGNPFEYFFADESFGRQYENDQRFATLFGVFAGLTILIACLGLFGLAAFTAEQRTKEIGVRKVLGASAPGIVALLSRDFAVLVGIAFVVAVPASYYFMTQWLEGFAYRITPGPGVFLLAGGIALVIALGTVSYQAVRAALTDPVVSLRYE